MLAATTNPVVVKANSHSYRASELIALMQSRQTVKNFLQRLAVDWVQKEVEAGHVPLARRHRLCRSDVRKLAPGTDGSLRAAGRNALGR